jgi:hypothetical protein
MHCYLCWLLAFCLVGCTAVELRACEDFVYGTDSPTRLVDETIIDFLKKVALRESLEAVSFASDMQGDPQTVTIGLQAKRSFNIAQARKFMVQKAEDFLAIFNRNQKIRLFLHEYPCNIHLLKLKIEFVKPDRTPEEAPYVTSATISSGNIYYKSYDRKTDATAVTSETYEEAYGLVKSSNH